MCKSFQPRRFAVFQVCLQNNQRQKQQKQKCVKSRKVLLIVKAAAKLCCRRRSLYSTKTRNQGRVVFPSEISTLPLTPHFCSETLSIMIREYIHVAHAKRRGLKELCIVKPSGRALVSGSYIVTGSPFDRAENRPCFKNFSAEMEDVGGVTSEGN